jgi:hypothetical protein
MTESTNIHLSLRILVVDDDLDFAESLGGCPKIGNITTNVDMHS